MELKHLLFIVIIIVAFYADVLGIVVAVGIIAAALLIIARPTEPYINMLPAEKAPIETPYDDEDVPWQTQDVLSYPQDSMEKQALHTSYGTCYDPVKPVIGNSGADLDGSADAMLALTAQKRARDKKTSDGWALKDADYFRTNYSWELDVEEQKPWWGRAEY